MSSVLMHVTKRHRTELLVQFHKRPNIASEQRPPHETIAIKNTLNATTSQTEKDGHAVSVKTVSTKSNNTVLAFREPGLSCLGQEWSISNFSCRVTRNITSRGLKNLAFYSIPSREMIILLIFASLIHLSLKGGGNVRVKIGNDRINKRQS